MIRVDTSQPDIVVVRYRGEPSEAEFKQYLDELAEVYARGRRFAMVFDAADSAMPPAGHRKLQADWMSAREGVIRTLNLGTAFVIPNTLLRGALTAILWLQPLPSMHEVFGDFESALQWAKERATAANAGASGVA